MNRVISSLAAAGLVAAFTIVVVTPCAAASPDVNDDGVINILDVSLVSSCQGRDPLAAPCLRADVDEDGDIDATDLGLVLGGPGSAFPSVEVDAVSGTVEQATLDNVSGAAFVTEATVVPPIVQTGGQPAVVRLSVVSVASSETSLVLGLDVPSTVPAGIYPRLLILRPGVDCDPMLVSPRECARLRVLANQMLSPRVFRALIDVAPPPTDEVPDGPSIPSADRLVTLDNGVTIVEDEVIVNLARATENPDEVALRIAAENFGAVVGSTPSKSYQIRFTVANVTQLGQIAADIFLNNPEVNSVLPHVLYPASGALAGTAPHPTEVESWFSDVEAAGAWALTAPSSAADERTIDVAVVDCGFEASHGDLANNVNPAYTASSVSVGTCAIPYHGTKVAGVLDAEWNNPGVAGAGDAGVAGMAQNHAHLRLYQLPSASTFAMQLKNAFDNAITVLPSNPTSVINVSIDLLENYTTMVVNGSFPEYCDGFPSGIPCPTVKEACNNLIAHSITGVGSGKEIVYVFAAGNAGRDASLACPAALASSRSDVITVAAIQQACGAGPCTLAGFSNFDPVTVAGQTGVGTVTVAAPGVNIRTTSGTNAYAVQSGTSFATPIVSGLAALILSRDANLPPAEVKTKIRTYATKTIQSHPQFNVINATAAVQNTELPLPDKLDLVIAIDLTGSMIDELGAIQSQIVQVVNALQTQIPDTRLGVVTYQDYPIAFPGGGNTCGSNYSAQYGNATLPASPYNEVQSLVPIGSFNTSVVTNLVAVSASGQDLPESYARVFFEVADAAGASQFGFRPASEGALRVLFNFGDDVPHDVNLNEGIMNPPIQQGSSKVYDTGVDPGRNGIADCGGDDVDFNCDLAQPSCPVSALGAMAAADVHLVHVDSSGDNNFEPYWEAWAARTHGAFARLTPTGGLPPGQPDLTTFMLDQLRLIEAQ